MALFRKNKTDQAGMPAEVTDYYKAEGRERAWVAWLLAIATLLVTVIVVLGLFYGGRWAYRELKGSNKPANVAIETDESKDETPEEPASNPPATNTPAESGSSSNSGPQTSSTSTSQPSSTGTTSTSSSTGTQTNADDLPATGPTDTLAIFTAVSVLAYVAHRRFLTN